MITTCKGFSLRLKGNSLTLPSKVKIQLNNFLLKKIKGNDLRSVTISSGGISITFAKQVNDVKCGGVIGIDTNLESVTYAETSGNIKRLSMRHIVQTKQRYREVKRHLKRNDARIRKEIFSKYGKLQADKCQTEIHKITARIVKHARKNNLAIALEDIKGIRKLYRKGNGQGKDFRSRLNAWAFGEFQRQLDYKAKLSGLPVIYVKASGSSAKCSTCGDKTFAEENRKLYCPTCKRRVDRDENASINIRNRGFEKLFSMRFEPCGLSGEAVKGNPMKKERMTEVILQVDGSQLSTSGRNELTT